LDFYSEDVASYVFEVLKTMNRITKRQLLELKIPAQPYLKNLINQYRKDKEKIVKNDKTIEELEKQIDDLVYKLYDISYTERRIVEDYLKKF
jgi:polyhydroxyalkanoate synthesis regulator phasin